MTTTLWSQDFFGKGELSPLMYSRITLNAYYQSLKTAKNVICYPQGAAGKRFGTLYLNEVTAVTDYSKIYFKSFPYLNECCYLVLFYNDNIAIYLEGYLIATVAATGIMADEVRLIDHTILENLFRVTTGIYEPKDLTRTSNAANLITGFTINTLTVTNALAVNGFWPTRFTTTVTLPVTTPQIHANRTYFVRAIGANSIRIYLTAEDAAANTNFFSVASAGVGANNIYILNTWTFANVPFTNLPVHDFTGGYSTSSFTPAAVTGYSILITRTAGAFNFVAAYVGGLFSGNGGICRIIATNGTNQATVNIVTPFNSLAAIPGTDVLIAEPAWSTARGYPRKCSSFQNRAFFANTDLLTNSVWASVVNEFNNFNDLEGLDDDAISWTPTSDTVNYIQFIVPYRSLTIHTNSGVYSTPLSVETAITPKNFSLSLQDSTPADSVQPRGIDNQIIVLSGNDAHSLLWDGFNNAYTSNIISIANEQLIRTPTDESEYVDKTRAGSRYMFIINADGSMAIYQTLIAEDVSGFTPAYMEQSYGNAYFRWVTSNSDGRAWFIIEREIGVAAAPVALTANSADTLTAVASNFSLITATTCSFAGTALPTTTPQIVATEFYWAIGVTANTFRIYLSKVDADLDTNRILITNFGNTATVIAYPLTTKLYLEQLSFDAKMDCTGFYAGAPVANIAGQTRFNGQTILMQGDGFGFEDNIIGGSVDFNAHGSAVSVSSAQYGFPINVEITPLPLSIPISQNARSSNLVDPKHIRFAQFIFADTIGGTITQSNNVQPIAIRHLIDNPPGFPPVPATGKFEISVFGGWDDFNYPSFTINHTEPFDIKLTGIFYRVDV